MFQKSVFAAVEDFNQNTTCNGVACPVDSPYCDQVGPTHTCRAITCADMSNYCHDEGISGLRTRQMCPHTCGCDHADSSLVLVRPSDGCSPMCYRTATYQNSTAQVACRDLPKDHPNF